jgi:CMP-N,N'-diacetyllegionaminic acid synthase
MKRLAVICARGGSKGIAGKNLMNLAGKPLLGYSLEQANEAGLFDAVAVSSDSQQILDLARDLGADHLVERPAELATDAAPKVPAIRHCTELVENELAVRFDTIVDLDATSPLRNRDDIKGAVGLLESSDATNVVTAMPSRRSPYFNLVELADDQTVHLSKPLPTSVARRQDSPPSYDLNASVFVWRRKALFEGGDSVFGERTRLYVMPEERSIDIDTMTDFKFVEYLMAERASMS